MRFLLKSLFVITILFIILNNSCNEKTMCTMMYSYITVTLKDSLNNAILLDSCFTKLNITNQIFYIETDSFNINQGIYNIFTDSQISSIPKNQNTEISFIGYKNSNKIIDEKYLVTQDGCHIKLVTGKTNIIIKP